MHRAPHLTSALEVPSLPFPLCHTEQAWPKGSKTQLTNLREIIQLMDFWAESRGGDIFFWMSVLH